MLLWYGDINMDSYSVDAMKQLTLIRSAGGVYDFQYFEDV